MGTLQRIYGVEGESVVRARRKRRARACRELASIVRMYAEGSPQRFAAESRADAINQVRRDPRFTGAQKDAKFVSLLNR